MLNKIKTKFKQIIIKNEQFGTIDLQKDLDSFSFKEIYEKVRGNLSGQELQSLAQVLNSEIISPSAEHLKRADLTGPKGLSKWPRCEVAAVAEETTPLQY